MLKCKQRKIWQRAHFIAYFTGEFLFIIRKFCKFPTPQHIERTMLQYEGFFRSGKFGKEYKKLLSEKEWLFVKERTFQTLIKEINGAEKKKANRKIAPLEKRVDRLAKQYRIGEDEKNKLLQEIKETK